MTRPTQVVIDLKALRHNLARVWEVAPGTRVMAIIKADGYGHGLVRVARALEDADGFGVACLDEALRLREAGVNQRILLLEGFFSPDELALIRHLALDVVVHRQDQVEDLERSAHDMPVRVWLKLDTGMHRLGFEPERLIHLWQRLQRCPQVAWPVRVMTHLASADDRRDRQTLRQLEDFFSRVAGLDTELSVANSAGILGWPGARTHWVRPGIMLYGVSPFSGGLGSNHGLEPVMTLSTQLIAVHRVPKGDAVGYGGTWVCPEDMSVGVAAVGYGDGYPRHAASGTPVLVNGERVPLIGRVSMDMITVDLRAQADARPGDPVVLWGRGLPVEEVAHHAETIAYELLCRVTPRVKVVEEEG